MAFVYHDKRKQTMSRQACLLPLDRRQRLRRDVAHDAIHAHHLFDDARRQPWVVSLIADHAWHICRKRIGARSIYAAWAARQRPGGAALAVTVNGTPATPAADGRFDVSVAG